MSHHVVIVGAGLAGIAASAALHDRGIRTTLIERRRLLGGRASSFHDPVTGQLLDASQHVLLGCCTDLLKLYRRLGVLDRIRFFDHLHFADETNRQGTLYASTLPAPLHLAPAMLRFPLLTLAQKSQVARAMAAIHLLHGAANLDAVTFEHWLRDHGQSPQTIARFWDVIITSALNEPARTASALHCIQVFRDAFLGPRDAWRMAIADVPLADLYAAAPASHLLLATRVAALTQHAGRITGVTLANGRHIPADAVILATAPHAARTLLLTIDTSADPSLINLARFQFSPIIGAHFWYDRPVMPQPHLALIGRQIHWLFRKDSPGQHLHAVISAADHLADLPPEKLAATLDAEIRQILPAAAGATLVHHRVIKEKHATYRPLPGTNALRPAQRTKIPGLILAGDYTQTGWPATMESAVRSGLLAATAASLA